MQAHIKVCDKMKHKQTRKNAWRTCKTIIDGMKHLSNFMPESTISYTAMPCLESGTKSLTAFLRHAKVTSFYQLKIDSKIIYSLVVP